MAIIDASVDINASVDKVWDIISDLDGEPKFWKGIKETRMKIGRRRVGKECRSRWSPYH